MLIQSLTVIASVPDSVADDPVGVLRLCELLRPIFRPLRHSLPLGVEILSILPLIVSACQREDERIDEQQDTKARPCRQISQQSHFR
jgi:hypothetical protein